MIICRTHVLEEGGYGQRSIKSATKYAYFSFRILFFWSSTEKAIYLNEKD